MGKEDKVTYGTEPFYENLEMAIENLLSGKVGEVEQETFDWELEGTGILGFRAWREGNMVKVEIKSG